MLRRTWPIFCGVLAADAASKWLAVLWLSEPPGSYAVLPIFSLTLVFNPGISFGLLGANTTGQSWGLSGLGLAIIAFLVWLASRCPDRWEQTGYAVIIAGAVGNVADRMHDGLVTDFLDFHLAGWRFPTFNLADTAITLGAATIFLRAALVRPPPAPA